MIEFMRRNYQVLCFDMSGNLELYSLEIMRESRRVLLILYARAGLPGSSAWKSFIF